MDNIITLINITEQFTLDHGKTLAKQFLLGATDLGRVTKHLEHFIDKTNLKQVENAHKTAEAKLTNFKADPMIEPDVIASKQSRDSAVSEFDKFNKAHPSETYDDNSIKPKPGSTDLEQFVSKGFHWINNTKKKNEKLAATHNSLLDNVEKLKSEHDSVVERFTRQYEDDVKNSNANLQSAQTKFNLDAERLSNPKQLSEKIARNAGRVSTFGLGAAALYPHSSNNQLQEKNK